MSARSAERERLRKWAKQAEKRRVHLDKYATKQPRRKSEERHDERG